MYFSFVLRQKKRYQKKNSRLHFRGYSDTAIAGRGSNSLRSDNRPLPGPDSAYADAPTVRPGDHAAKGGGELCSVRGLGVDILDKKRAKCENMKC